MSAIALPFSADFQPSQLPAKDFVEFTLHMMAGYYVDLTQPHAWTKVACEDGRGITASALGRILVSKMTPLGAVLTPKLLARVITTFKLHGPEIAADISFATRHPDGLAGRWAA